jgi:hypothetical protein
LSYASSRPLKTLALWMGLPLLPLSFLEALRWVSDVSPSLSGTAIRWSLVMGTLLLGQVGALRQVGQGRWLWPWQGVAILGAAAAMALGYGCCQTTGLAWLLLGGLYALLLILAGGAWRLMVAVRHRWLRFFLRITVLGVASTVGGLVPVAIGQVESRFADEEFFVFVQGLALALFCGLLLLIHLWLSTRQGAGEVAMSRRGICLNVRWTLVGLLLLALVGGWAMVRSYQTSFYPAEAPALEGISPDEPFLCGEMLLPGDGHPDGEAVFHRLLEQIEANPDKVPPDYGMLALVTGEQRWAETFRDSLLDEATEGRFTGAANSVKSVQHDAALRLYYLWKVQETFPHLFTDADQALLYDWFAAINVRAMTSEWVDWMYALAFSKWPEGPYENQENGAGLLALLELSGYAAPQLSSTNRDYLARNERGWQERFRNTDDAFVYQPEWMTNALFQSLYTDRSSEHNQRLSFEWLLLQSLPDGAVWGYNHPVRAPVAGTAYLGASLLNDPRLLWLADRSLAQVEAEGQSLHAQPGLEMPVTFAGQPPTEASCLLYGDSGLPNQVGPLAPDKIVFRDGWSPDSAYAMLNLRFTGWHRYKATNTVTLLYQGGPLVVERNMGQPVAWLPEGRSLFRDKRIPRENLNGLLIERAGMGAALYELTGVGGRWAQDPPFYARVERFETLGPLDVSRTVVDDWHGWQHGRTVYFFHGGPIIVVDEAASSSESGSAAISWHLVGGGQREDENLWLREGDGAARVVWPSEIWPSVALRHEPAALSDQPNLHALYLSSRQGYLDLVTAWLVGTWADGQYQATTWREPGSEAVLGYHLRLSGTAGSLDLLHNATSERLEVGELATDGEAIIVERKSQEETTLCVVGGSVAKVSLADKPVQVTTLEGKTLRQGEAWEWQAGRLIVRKLKGSWCVRIR